MDYSLIISRLFLSLLYFVVTCIIQYYVLNNVVNFLNLSPHPYYYVNAHHRVM